MCSSDLLPASISPRRRRRRGAVADQPAPSGQSGQSGQSAWSGHSAQSAQSGQSAWSGQSAQSAAPAVDEDGEEDWSEPLNWNQVVGRRQNGQS